MKNILAFLWIKVLILLIVAANLFLCCTSIEKDEVIRSFGDRVEHLSPSDSVCLSDFGILMPEKIFKYDDWLIIRKYSSKNFIDIINIETREIIPCFAKGRGNGEVLNIGSVYLCSNLLCVYDIWSSTYYELDVPKTILRKKPVYHRILPLTSLTSTKEGNFSRLFSIYPCDDIFVISGLWNDKIWYRTLDSTGISKSGVPHVNFDNLAGFNNMETGAFHMSSTTCINTECNKVIFALRKAGAFSISEIKENSISEKVRKIYYAPLISTGENEKSPIISYSPDNRQAFCDTYPTKSQLFFLYSGREQSFSKEPPYQCENILVYDWNAAPQKRYLLSKSINSFCIEGSRIYGASSYPDGMIYIYSLDSSEIE